MADTSNVFGGFDLASITNCFPTPGTSLHGSRRKGGLGLGGVLSGPPDEERGVTLGLADMGGSAGVTVRRGSVALFGDLVTLAESTPTVRVSNNELLEAPFQGFSVPVRGGGAGCVGRAGEARSRRRPSILRTPPISLDFLGCDSSTPIQGFHSCPQAVQVLPTIQESEQEGELTKKRKPKGLAVPSGKELCLPEVSASVLTEAKVQSPGDSSVHGGAEAAQGKPPGPPLNALRQSVLEARQRAGRMCKVAGCQKGARGVSGLCIAHGGGKRCAADGCIKGAEGRTPFCKAHGGGKRCQYPGGCAKSAEGKTQFCIAHGGGKRCEQDGCSKSARGSSGFCIRHGGGKRCQVDGCKRSAEGFSGHCISHGGGRRCQFVGGCNKGAQGSTPFCKAHGGGKRCCVPGCSKGAEGRTMLCKGHGGGKRCTYGGGGVCARSVHGGTAFCVAHGGGKRCQAPDCTKSARGKTDYCVRHGGGKRCKVEACGKSAQGKTDFCKAHGGGKRCMWSGEGGCTKFARGRTGHCVTHGAWVRQIALQQAATKPTALEESSATSICSTLEHPPSPLPPLLPPQFQTLFKPGSEGSGHSEFGMKATPPQRWRTVQNVGPSKELEAFYTQVNNNPPKKTVQQHPPPEALFGLPPPTGGAKKLLPSFEFPPNSSQLAIAMSATVSALNGLPHPALEGCVRGGALMPLLSTGGDYEAYPTIAHNMGPNWLCQVNANVVNNNQIEAQWNGIANDRTKMLNWPISPLLMGHDGRNVTDMGTFDLNGKGVNHGTPLDYLNTPNHEHLTSGGYSTAPSPFDSVPQCQELGLEMPGGVQLEGGANLLQQLGVLFPGAAS